MSKPTARPAGLAGTWVPIADEPGHPLARIDGETLGEVTLRLFLGPTSRFGARYFVMLGEADGKLSVDAAVSGLHHSGPLPSYNWIEVAETRERLTLEDGSTLDLGPDATERLFALLLATIPLGGHFMVEYDSAQRSETADGLAHKVPAIATPLGSMLFRLGCGAHFKDWQIAEGGAEGPRKLQAYVRPTDADAARWRASAREQLAVFVEGPLPDSPTVRAARERAATLLDKL